MTTKREREPAESREDLGDIGEVFALLDADPTADVYLYRIAPPARFVSGPAYLDRFTGRAPDLAEIRERYGGGTFKLLVKRGKMMVGAKQFGIEGAPRFQEAEIPVPSDTPAGAVPRRAIDEARGVPPFDALRRDVDRILQVLASRERDPEEEDEREARRDRREFARLLREQAVLRAFREESASDPLALVERVMDIYDRMRKEQDGGDSPWGNLAGLALQAFGKSVLPAPPAPPANGSTVPELPAKSAAAALQEEAAVQRAREQEAHTLSMLRHVADCAEGDREPAALVPWALELLPNELKARIPTLTAGEWLGIFLVYRTAFPSFGDPKVQAWLDEFRQALAAELTRDRAPAEPGRQAG